VTDIAPAPLVRDTAQFYESDRFQLRVDGKDDQMVNGYMRAVLEMCRTIMTSQDPDLVNMVENGDYDLAFINALFGECGVMIANYHKLKFIEYSANTVMAWSQEAFGIPAPLSYIPDITGKPTEHPMGFYERFSNLLRNYEWSSRSAWFNEGMEELMKTRYNLTSVQSFAEMERDASLFFYNSHHALDFARPLPPMFIPVGGMACLGKLGTLEDHIQEFMDGAEQGVILISFGSTVLPNTMSPHFRTTFYNMMRKFKKVRFIWRWKGEVPEDAPENLLGVEWFPQKEILSKLTHA
jgi:glucuronosyltransferase